jgi:hypothetical protein
MPHFPEEEAQTTESCLQDYAAATRAIDTALRALFDKCARTKEIKRSVTRETLCCTVLWQTIRMLDVEHVKQELVAILAEQVGFTEARQLIDAREAEKRAAAAAALLIEEEEPG